MSPCVGCAVFCVDESGHDMSWKQEWVNDECPKCGRGFDLSDCTIADENNVVYHHDCFEGPKSPLNEDVSMQC